MNARKSGVAFYAANGETPKKKLDNTVPSGAKNSEGVTTKADECKLVEQILSLFEVHCSLKS